MEKVGALKDNNTNQAFIDLESRTRAGVSSGFQRECKHPCIQECLSHCTTDGPLSMWEAQRFPFLDSSPLQNDRSLGHKSQ